MKFCEECGAKLEDDAIFCEECGATVGDVESIQVVAEPVPIANSIPGNAPIKKKKKVSKVPIIVGSIVVVLILAVVIGVVCFLGRNEDKKDDTMTAENEIEEVEDEETEELEDTAHTDDAVLEEETVPDVDDNAAVDQNTDTENLVSIFNADLYSDYMSWYYKVETPEGVNFTIWDDPTAQCVTISNGEFFHDSYSLEGLYYGVEYGVQSDVSQDAYGNSYYQDAKITVQEDGADIKWKLCYDSYEHELCNGFYGPEYITCTSSYVKYDNSLKMITETKLADYNTDCFYKRVKDGKIESVRYYGYDEESLSFEITKDHKFGSTSIHLWSETSIDGMTFYPQEDIFYNKETVFFLKPQNSSESYRDCVEMNYSLDQNGNKQYDLSNCIYYYEVRLRFTEDGVDIYWSFHENEKETVIYDDYFNAMYVEKHTNIKNY